MLRRPIATAAAAALLPLTVVAVPTADATKGDRGAPPIPLGGGSGDAVGNANALASRWARDNEGHYRPITYGSSHIQAISFLDGGRLDARTMLTYGQSENPRSAYSSDQTRLFSRERWVRFAWTDDQIHQDLVRRYVVSAPGR